MQSSSSSSRGQDIPPVAITFRRNQRSPAQVYVSLAQLSAIAQSQGLLSNDQARRQGRGQDQRQETSRRQDCRQDYSQDTANYLSEVQELDVSTARIKFRGRNNCYLIHMIGHPISPSPSWFTTRLLRTYPRARKRTFFSEYESAATTASTTRGT